jgi:hypothetical protein
MMPPRVQCFPSEAKRVNEPCVEICGVVRAVIGIVPLRSVARRPLVCRFTGVVWSASSAWRGAPRAGSCARTKFHRRTAVGAQTTWGQEGGFK